MQELKIPRKTKKTKRPPVEELAKVYAEHTTKEIAAMYKVPEGTVKSWIYRYRHEKPAEVCAE